MTLGSLDENARSQLWPNAMAMLIMAAMSVTLLAFSPWGFDPVFSPLAHFLKLWPLLLLALLTYVAKVKLDDPEREVP